MPSQGARYTVKVNWKDVGIEDPENTKEKNNNKNNNNETMRRKLKDRMAVWWDRRNWGTCFRKTESALGSSVCVATRDHVINIPLLHSALLTGKAASGAHTWKTELLPKWKACSFLRVMRCQKAWAAYINRHFIRPYGTKLWELGQKWQGMLKYTCSPRLPCIYLNSYGGVRVLWRVQKVFTRPSESYSTRQMDSVRPLPTPFQVNLTHTALG